MQKHFQKPLGAKPCITSKAFLERSEPTFRLTILFISFLPILLQHIQPSIKPPGQLFSSIWNKTNCLAGIILHFFVDTLFCLDFFFFHSLWLFYFIDLFLAIVPSGADSPFRFFEHFFHFHIYFSFSADACKRVVHRFSMNHDRIEAVGHSWLPFAYYHLSV